MERKETIQVGTRFEYERIIDQIGDIGLVEMGQNKALINLSTGEVKGIFRGFPEKHDDFFILIEEGHDKRGFANFITIYDAINEEYVVRRARLVEMQGINDSVGQRLSRILIEVAENEYRLFDIKNYHTKQNSFARRLTEVEYLGDDYFMLSDGTKKAIYFTADGLLTDFNNDEIKHIQGTTIAILTRNGRDIVKPLEGATIKTKSKSYKKIRHNGLYVLFCEKAPKSNSSEEHEVEVYVESITHNWTLFTTLTCEDVDALQTNYLDNNAEYCLLKVKNNGKWTLKEIISATSSSKEKAEEPSSQIDDDDTWVLVEDDELEVEEQEGTPSSSKEEPEETPSLSEEEPKANEVSPLSFDEIEKYTDGIFVLEKDGKFGLCYLENLHGEVAEPYVIDPAYEKIEFVDNASFALLFSNGKCDIASLASKKIVLSDVEIVTIIPEKAIIYKKDGKVGILHKWGAIKDGFDNVEYLGNNFYLVTENNLKGILRETEEKIKPQYVSINFDQGFDDNREQSVNISLGKADGTYDLGRLTYYTCNNGCEYKKLSEKSFNKIEFFDGIIVCTGSEETELYDRKGTLKATYSGTVNVSEIIVDNSLRKANYFSNHYYSIDGEYRNIYGDKVNLTTAIKKYVCYEGQYGRIYVSGLTEDDFKDFDGMTQEEFDQVMKELDEKHNMIEKYPDLKIGVHPAMKEEE